MADRVRKGEFLPGNKEGTSQAQVPSTQPLTQPLPQHAKEHPVITVTTAVLNLDMAPRSTPTDPVYVCLLPLAFDIFCSLASPNHPKSLVSISAV